ncbi:hypothetical protein [Nannocystis pusilla]|uniref:Carbohydrate kinase PfkB domain-containing protein n=1 Tax=Nannocystis pusilla TaxID=889268 RepID=A0ABS7U5E2_9BACT|nr:hypothetical protein [Nannocystis pusilla]MBZ5715668.1 hypothetical protein [Nannocystis pusilla]
MPPAVSHWTPDAKLRAGRTYFEPGGGINIARALRRLGERARALWLCSGTDGQRLGALLDAEGIEHEPVLIADERATGGLS